MNRNHFLTYPALHFRKDFYPDIHIIFIVLTTLGTTTSWFPFPILTVPLCIALFHFNALNVQTLVKSVSLWKIIVE